MDYRDIFDQISKGAEAAGEFIVDKAVLAKDYTVLSGEIVQLRNRINNLYKSAGKALYLAHSAEAENAAEIEGYMVELSQLHQTLQEKEEARKALQNK